MSYTAVRTAQNTKLLERTPTPNAKPNSDPQACRLTTMVTELCTNSTQLAQYS